MNIRPGAISDAGSIANLVRGFESLLVEDAGTSAPFWESMSEAAHAQNLGSKRFHYFVAESDGQLLGYIAMRDDFHLFNVFVSLHHQRRGIARALWNTALQQLPNLPADRPMTVNASLNAVAVYRAFGFVEAGSVVRAHGIAFLPMQRDTVANAA